MSQPVVSTSHYYLNRFRTNVRRQDSTSAVAPLGDELREFLHSSYPDWSSSMITPGFQYDTKKLQKTEGFPEVARDMVKSRSSDARDMIKWTSEAMGMRAEEKVFTMLERRFYNEPCLLLPGYVETHLFRVARAVLPGIVEDDFPLSAEELEMEHNL